MAEFETNDVELDLDLSNEDDTDDNNTELTVEDYQKERNARIKAEDKWVKPTKALMKELGVKSLDELKSKLAKTETPNTITEEELVLREEMSEFLSENQDLKEYKSELLKYAKKMLADGDSMKTALRKAKALVENDDKTIENRRKTNSMNISEGEATGKTVYSYDELEKMTQDEYNKVKALQLKGQVKFK